mgnify:CR=1 FL=1
METNKAYCKNPVILKNWQYHVVETLHDIGYRDLFFHKGSTQPLMVHHNYIFTTDKIPNDAIDCGNNVHNFFKEIIK